MKKTIFFIVAFFSINICLSQTFEGIGYLSINRDTTHEISDSIVMLTKRIELNSYDSEAYFKRGVYKTILQDHRGAIVDFSKVIELNPNKPEPYAFRGFSKNYLSDYRGAIVDFTKVISFNPVFSEAFIGRGLARAELKDYKGAIDDYNKAIEINSSDPDAYFGRGLSMIGIGQKDNGCLDLSKAGELGHPKAYDAIREFCGAPSDLNYSQSYEDRIIKDGVGIGYSLAGRIALTLPQPQYPKQKSGKVVVRVTVDTNGNITQVEGGVPGSTTLDTDLIKAAEKAAKMAKFDVKPDAPAKQTGTITYIYKLQQ